MKNLVGAIIAVTCSIIILGLVLVPVIDDIQLTSGDKVTYANPQDDGNLYMRAIQDGDVLSCVVSADANTTIALNGESLLTIAGDSFSGYHSLIFSDVFGCNTSNSASGLQAYSDQSTSIGYNSSCTIEYDSGTFTLTPSVGVAQTYSGATWGYIACNEDEAEYYETVRTGSSTFYVSSSNDVICSGLYTTGDLDTFYWYHMGDSGVAVEGYDGNADVDLVLVDGTTDVYLASIAFEVTDGTDTESFTPYRIMIPLEVSGHATSGAAYSLYGVIPVIVIISIVFMVAGMIYSKRD